MAQDISFKLYSIFKDNSKQALETLVIALN